MGSNYSPSIFSCSAAASGSSDIFSNFPRKNFMVLKAWSRTDFSLSTVMVHRVGRIREEISLVQRRVCVAPMDPMAAMRA